MCTTFNTYVRKALYGIMLLGMMLSICLGISSVPIARAHEAATESPTAIFIATDTAVETQAPIEAAASSCTTIQNGTCTQTQSGLSLCRLNNVCVVKVDLNENSLRPRVVIAPNGGTSWLSSMASNVGAYAAINGDYFSGCPDTTSPLNCGEGLTFIDGTDYTDYTGSEWQNRRSLGFNDNYDPNIGWPGEQGGYHRQLLAGGPQVTFGGEYRWRCWYQGSNTEGNCACQNNTVVINDELFGCSANNWWNRPQTFIAFSDDRNTLYLAVSEPGYNKTPHEMHDVLWVQGARYALKMDGGGSSGMYFNSGGYSFIWDGGRAIANAWAVVPNNQPPPPPPCDPSSDQVALFTDPNYGGSCVVKGLGNYPNPGSMGIANDSLSSIKVGGNVKLTLCRDDNYSGTCETFTEDDPNLGDNGIGDNQASSAKVENRNVAPPAPTLVNPGNGSSNPFNYDLNFQWNSSSGASEYMVEWWGGPYSTMQPCGWSSSTSCHIGTVASGYTYSWHVKARNGAGESNWSDTWTFTIQPQPLPDLVPYPRPGAAEPIVISRTTGNRNQDTLISGQTAYIDWGFKNTGQADAGQHHVKIWIDGQLYIDYPFSGLGAGYLGGFDDWGDGDYIAPGAHTVTMTVDANSDVNESDESNNTWTGTFYWRAPSVNLDRVFTTDDIGPAGLDTTNSVQIEDVQVFAYKDTFNPGDPIRLYLELTNEFPDDRTITGEWQVINPAGRVVPELSYTGTTTLGSGGWWWWLNRTIPTYSLRGQYTFIGKITYNGVTTTQTTTFTVAGPPTVEVYDVFVTDANGNVASLEAEPRRSPILDINSQTAPTFNSGNGIRLYIDTYNDVVDGEAATFKWEVIDPWERSITALQWDGDLNSSLGHTWWYLPVTIPSNAITGDYAFTGYITHGSRMTYQSTTFHVNGPAGPANDDINSPTIINGVPYTTQLDTWGATVAANDPVPSCGSSQNSNSVWYRYTPPENGVLHVDTQGSDYDTVVAIWTGSPGNLSEFACNDDSFSARQSWLEILVMGGRVYYIEVMDYGWPGGGNLNLNIDFAVGEIYQVYLPLVIR